MIFRNACILSGLLTLAACGTGPETSVVKDDDRSGSIAIFSMDSDGRVSFGRPTTRDLRIEINGSRSGRATSTGDGGSTFEKKSEKPTHEDTGREPPSEKDCFVHEAARERFQSGDKLPTIRATTELEIREERYRTRQEAEQAFGHQMAAAKERLTDAWQANKPEIDALRGAIKAGALTHNKDVLRTLAFTGDLVDAGADLAKDFKTSPLTSHGAMLRRAARDVGNGFKTLGDKFSGKELADRSAILKDAGNLLKVADAVFSEGDADSGEYLTNVALTMVDVAVSYMPMVSWAKDIVEAATGYSMIYQRPLTTTERAFAIVGAVTGGIGSKVITTQKAVSAWRRFFMTSEAGQSALEAVRRAAQML
jgi:hypothetical protein